MHTMISRTYDEPSSLPLLRGAARPGRPEDPRLDGAVDRVGILGKGLERQRRPRPRLIKPANEAAVSRPVSKIDRKAYMRDLMRRLRAEKRAARAALALALPTLALGCRHCPLNPVTLVACPGVTGVTVTAFSTGFGRSSPFPRPSPT